MDQSIRPVRVPLTTRLRTEEPSRELQELAADTIEQLQKDLREEIKEAQSAVREASTEGYWRAREEQEHRF